MKRIFCCVAVVCGTLIAGCINTHYVGRSYPPTPESEIIAFYNRKQPLPENRYQPIGRAVTVAPDSYNSAEIKQEILSQARKHGADAVKVVDFKRILVAQQQIPQNSIEDNRTFGQWGNDRRADGSKIKVNAGGEVVPMRSQRYDRYQLRARVIFLRLKSKMSHQEGIIASSKSKAAADMKQKKVEVAQPDRNNKQSK